MIGLIIWGSRSESLDLGVVDHRYCNTCRGIRPFKIILQYRYFHIYWIFGWIMSKEYVLACDFCYKGWILKPSEVEKNFFRHPIPFMRRYGLLFLGAFFLILMASSIVSSPLETVDSKLSPSNSTASTPPLTIQPSQNTSTPTYSRPFLSVIPPAAIALLDAPWKAAAVVALYVVIQQVESNILTPLVMKRRHWSARR